MTTRAGVVLLLAFVAVFLALNAGAYRGYFQDDEIDNISWTRWLPLTDFAKGVATPLTFENNFRPVGHFYFHAIEAAAGLDFPVYVAVLQAFHLLNVWLLWGIMRRMGATAAGAALACCFFGLHMALFDSFWKPMYVFDVLCATFCLGSIAAWLRGRWVWSLAAFWLAYKCKELAVMLPAVLAICEWWFGKRRWKLLVPFFAVSVSFGVQGMLRNAAINNDYTFRFTLEAIGKTLPFYAGRVFLLPWLGAAVLALAAAVRDRRMWFGLSMMALFFFPLLFLPGRMFSAYCYLPFTGLAIALSGVNAPALAVAIALWMPMNLRELRVRSRETLSQDGQIQTWMAGVQQFAATGKQVDGFIFSGEPAGFERWGVEGAIRYWFPKTPVKWIEEPGAREWMAGRHIALIDWDWVQRRVKVEEAH
jgi:hypothetical protein